MKRLLLFVLLGLTLIAVANAKQPAPDDSLKARLWFFTVKRIWRDRQLKAQQLPLADNLTLTQVRDQLRAAEKNQADEGVYTLYKDVKTQVISSASPQNVSEVIITQLRIRQKSDPNQWKQLKLDSLDEQFAKLLTDAVSDRRLHKDSSSTLKTLTGDGAKQSAETSDKAEAINSEKNLSAVQADILPFIMAGLLGLLGGVTLAWVLLGRRHRTAMKGKEHYKAEVYKLRGELDAFKAENLKLSQQLEDTSRNQLRQDDNHNQDKQSSLASSGPPAPDLLGSSVAEVVPTGSLYDSALAVPPTSVPPLPPPTKHYAPATESAFLEDRILQPEALGHLPIELTLDPARPQLARFTLNPHIDQNHIIGDDVDRLKEFFSFIRPEKISTLRAGTVGELRREDGGWRVVKKAGLELS
jgi:hypothetical protein